MTNSEFIAHKRRTDGVKQSLKSHLIGVGSIASTLAGKIGLENAGRLIGMLHDLGKYSDEFQKYLKSATGEIDPDEDDWIDSKEKKGKIDHSTAGAKFIWNSVNVDNGFDKLAKQILALCIASHHSGLIDCIAPDGADNFSRRMNKSDKKTNLNEVLKTADRDLLDEARKIITQDFQDIERVIKERLEEIFKISNHRKDFCFHFQMGLLVRFLFSCLIDGDRIDTADFENPRNARLRQHGKYRNWDELIVRYEKFVQKFSSESKIDKIRLAVSQQCFEKGKNTPGLYTLTVPTGGGKTLSSLRFALQHAKTNKFDRIFYIIPFTTIIEQNADLVRKILEDELGDEFGTVVLELHSNIIVEKDGRAHWMGKILAENWDAPIIFTTNVQFLECLFGAGTRDARRMHQLANSVIIFDEIQTLPIRMVHMFNNAVNFLTNSCGSTVLLCTATQPLLGEVCEKKGVLKIGKENEIVSDVEALFSDLRRVSVTNCARENGWSDVETSGLVKDQVDEVGSCLVIVNTKKKAKEIYTEVKKHAGKNVFHLSTNMCAAHRVEIFAKIKNHLGVDPVTCVSTQLIEAGVDIDFGCVIRSIAGLDSIAQAAGRCNRNGKRNLGKVFLINPTGENIEMLSDIVVGKEKTERIFREFKNKNTKEEPDWLSPEILKRYYEYYFFERRNEMDYPIEGEVTGTLLNLLSKNSTSLEEFARINQQKSPEIRLRQSFMTANKAFRVIGGGTQGIIVPYGEIGRQIIADLCGSFDVENDYRLLKAAQRYTVNIYPNLLKKLNEANAVYEAQDGSGIFCLKSEFYSSEFGVSFEAINDMEFVFI